VRRYILLCVICLSIGCSSRPHPVHVGLGGAIVGAGTGAAVGSLIANGDVTASAWLGAGIGLPIGLAAGYLYQQYLLAESEEERAYIRQRYIDIYEQDRLTELAWRKQQANSSLGELDESRAMYQYIGPMLGNPFR
jgi:hypothetical protein